MKKHLSILAIAICFCAPARAQLTSEALWKSYAAAPDTHANIPNCSFAGYARGEKPLPGEGNQIIGLQTSGTHVALILDRLRAVDHHQIVGCWPSLLIVTSTASLQLDPSAGLSGAQATLISGRLLRQVARWDQAIRRCDGTAPARLVDPLKTVGGI